jgi:tRNA(Arg) A34 adenosine deaminase TadA
MVQIAEHDVTHLRRAIALAREARREGNDPFGAVLVGSDGRILAEANSTVGTTGDVTGHAETNLVSIASRTVPADAVADATLYSSAEPCAMCAGAIFWSGVGRVVYGLSAERIYELFPPRDDRPVLRLACRDVLAAGTRPVEVVGPALEDEAERVLREQA